MNNNLLLLPAMASLMLLGCSKGNKADNNPSPAGAIKIEIVSGGGQADTVGKEIANPVVNIGFMVKHTKQKSHLLEWLFSVYLIGNGN